MASTKTEVVRFDGIGDFSIWKILMMVTLGVHGLKSIWTDDKLDMKVPLSKKEEKQPFDGDTSPSKPLTKFFPDPVKFEKDDQAKNLIILNIGYNVLKKIKHCETVASMWAALKRLYLPKTLPNRIFEQLQFYAFKSDPYKSINVNVDDFLKIVAEISSLNVSVSY